MTSTLRNHVNQQDINILIISPAGVDKSGTRVFAQRLFNAWKNTSKNVTLVSINTYDKDLNDGIIEGMIKK